VSYSLFDVAIVNDTQLGLFIIYRHVMLCNLDDADDLWKWFGFSILENTTYVTQANSNYSERKLTLETSDSEYLGHLHCCTLFTFKVV